MPKSSFYLLLFLGCSSLLTAAPGRAEPPLEQVRVLALAPAEGRAVVQWPDNTMQVVQIGERFQGTVATLRQVLPDRLVVEESPPHADLGGTAVLWLYQAPQTGGPGRLSRFQPHKPAETLLPIQQPLPSPPHATR
jgi:hypothetical protein